jgi:hypothetical protein
LKEKRPARQTAKLPEGIQYPSGLTQKCVRLFLCRKILAPRRAVQISSGEDLDIQQKHQHKIKEGDMFPTLVNLPGALALSALTAEMRLAAILHRQMHLALPASLSKHSAILMKLLLLAELALFVGRFAALLVEFLLLATARVASASAGVLLLAGTAVIDLAGRALVAAALLRDTVIPDTETSKGVDNMHSRQFEYCAV